MLAMSVVLAQVTLGTRLLDVVSGHPTLDLELVLDRLDRGTFGLAIDVCHLPEPGGSHLSPPSRPCRFPARLLVRYLVVDGNDPTDMWARPGARLVHPPSAGVHAFRTRDSLDHSLEVEVSQHLNLNLRARLRRCQRELPQLGSAVTHFDPGSDRW